MSETKLPALKNIPPKTDRELKIALDAIKESLEVFYALQLKCLERNEE